MRVMDDLISESKSILRRYMNLPLSKIPANDLEKFNLAYVVVQAALGREKFRMFLKGIES